MTISAVGMALFILGFALFFISVVMIFVTRETMGVIPIVCGILICIISLCVPKSDEVYESTLVDRVGIEAMINNHSSLTEEQLDYVIESAQNMNELINHSKSYNGRFFIGWFIDERIGNIEPLVIPENLFVELQSVN